MRITTRLIIFVAMSLLSIVSMWTTYKSLHDSILPEPVLAIPLWQGHVWQCSIFALGLSVAIGLMLFGLKLAIIDEQKRLSLIGILGLTFVGFISIAFNIDVLYRTADRDFFVRYANDKMRSVYEDYLGQVQGALTEKRTTILTEVARQEGELESEMRGLRQAPSGYGSLARKEDYQLTLLKKTSEVELQSIDEALASKAKVDQLLLGTEAPATIPEVMAFQDQLRVAAKDVGAAAGIRLPAVVKLENPFFAVFENLFNVNKVGFKEIFILIVAFLLDLGDIIGYSLVPKNEKKFVRQVMALHAVPDLPGPELIPSHSALLEEDLHLPAALRESPPAAAAAGASSVEQAGAQPERPRPFRFRRR